MGEKLDGVLNDVVLQNSLAEYIRQRNRAKAAVIRAKEMLDLAKPVMALDAKYSLVTPELDAEIASIKAITDTW